MAKICYYRKIQDFARIQNWIHHPWKSVVVVKICSKVLIFWNWFPGSAVPSFFFKRNCKEFQTTWHPIADSKTETPVVTRIEMYSQCAGVVLRGSGAEGGVTQVHQQPGTLALLSSVAQGELTLALRSWAQLSKKSLVFTAVSSDRRTKDLMH